MHFCDGLFSSEDEGLWSVVTLRFNAFKENVANSSSNEYIVEVCKKSCLMFAINIV